MALRPSSVPLRVPLPSPPASSLPDIPDPESDLARAASTSVPRLLATVVTDPSFESAAASALVAELVDFAAAYRLDYATSLVAESKSDCPPSIRVECALGTDVIEDRKEDFECLAAAVPHLVAMLLAPEGDPDALMQTHPDPSLLCRGNYVVKRPPGSPPVFKARYVARGFSQRQGVDFFKNFSPTPKMTTLRVLLHVAAQLDYELHSLDFSTAFLRGRLHEQIWLRRPSGFTWSFAAELVGCLMYLMTCTRPDLACPLSILARYVVPGRHRPGHWEAAKRVLRYLCSASGMGLVLEHAEASSVYDLATPRSSQGYNFSLGSGSASWRSTPS
ncbi:unnamed protein product [Closterium sp. NIES-54]